MNIAILIISSASLICSAGCLCIMAKTAKELQAAKAEVDTEVASLKTKVSRNAQVVKTALGQLEL